MPSSLAPRPQSPVFQFQQTHEETSRIVVEHSSEYLAAELVKNGNDADLVAMWVYPKGHTGIAIHTSNSITLDLQRKKLSHQQFDELLINEVACCMMRDYEALGLLFQNEESILKIAEECFSKELAKVKNLWILSPEEFSNYRRSIKADLKEGRVSKEEYTQKVKDSYKANNRFQILEMWAGHQLQKNLEKTYKLELTHYQVKAIYAYLHINKKQGRLIDQLIVKKRVEKPTCSKRKKKQKLPTTLYSYTHEYQQPILTKYEDEKKLVLAIDFKSEWLVAEFVQNSDDVTLFTACWQLPASLKGRQFRYRIDSPEGYPSDVFKAMEQFRDYESFIIDNLAQRIVFDVQFLEFVTLHHEWINDLYRNVREYYEAFPNCRGALSKQTATVLKCKLVISKKEGLITEAQRKLALRQIEKDRRKHERILRNTNDAMHRELSKQFGERVYYSYFSLIEQLIDGQLPSQQLHAMYLNQRIINQ